MIPDPTWQTVGRVPPEDVGAAGRQVQRAARWLAIAARHTIPPQPGDGHAALRWAPVLGGLATGGIEPDPGPMPGHPFRFALRPAGFSLLEVDEMGRVMQQVGLDGCSDDDVGLWVADRLAARGLPPVQHDGGGAKVASPPAEERDSALLCLGDGAAFAELSRWFANAELVLGGLAASYAGATPPRCWTDRFGLAVDVPLDGGSALGGDGPHLSAGLWASGGGAMPEPCFYVAPHPAPPPDDLPEPPAGAAWHTDGVVAAVVLPLSRVVTHRDGKAQQETVAGMLYDGVVRLAGG